MEFILIFGKLFGYTPTYANVSSGESPQGWQIADITTNIWNIQGFEKKT